MMHDRVFAVFLAAVAVAAPGAAVAAPERVSFVEEFGAVAWEVTLPKGFRQLGRTAGRADFASNALRLSLSEPLPFSSDDLADQLRLSHRLACERGNGAFSSARDGSGTATRLRVACVGHEPPLHAFAAEIGFVAAGAGVSIVAVSMDSQILDPAETAMMAQATRAQLDAEPVRPARGRR